MSAFVFLSNYQFSIFSFNCFHWNLSCFNASNGKYLKSIVSSFHRVTFLSNNFMIIFEFRFLNKRPCLNMFKLLIFKVFLPHFRLIFCFKRLSTYFQVFTAKWCRHSYFTIANAQIYNFQLDLRIYTQQRKEKIKQSLSLFQIEQLEYLQPLSDTITDLDTLE